MEEGQDQGGGETDQTPHFFGDYEVIRSIGKGKFAVVYRAHKIGDDQNVALKRISVDMMNDKAREKCLKEVRVLQNLDHPNIVRYMDSFICNNDLIIVYEWAAAGDLKRQLRKAQERGVGFEERVVWKYFSQICSAIQHMHEKRIMHRDLKPANIFLTLDGTVKVGDLGLSRELSDNTFQAHSKVGTPLYMSPEVLKGDGYDFKSDIWSLGCLLYELATLKSPFRSEGLNLYSLFQKISTGDYVALPDTYSEELRALSASMMSTRSEDRPDISYVVQEANRMREKTANEKKQKKAVATTGNVQREELDSNKQETEDAAEGKEEMREKTHALNDDLQKKESSRQMAIERDDWHQLQTAERKSRSRSAERRGPNPFQRVNSQNSLHPDEYADKDRVKERNGDHGPTESDDDDDEKTVVARGGEGVTLGEYFKHRDIEQQETMPQSSKPWSSSKQPQNDEDILSRRNSSPAYTDERPALRREDSVRSQQGTTSAASSRPSSSRPISGFPPTHAKIVPLDSEPQLPSKPIVYHRSKPPKVPSSSSNNGAMPSSSNNNATTTRVNSLEPVNLNSRPNSSRPASNYSRPSTVDDAPTFIHTAAVDRVNPKLLEALDNASPAFSLMDNVYGKLTVLGYPMQEPGVTQDRSGRGRLLPIHFAVNVSAFNSIAGCAQGYQFLPFKRMLHVIFWLCENKIKLNPELQRIIKSIDSENSTNMTIAKQLLHAAQTAGEVGEELNATTPTSLTPGFGYNVCLLLNHFADCALKAVGFTSHCTVHAEELAIGNDEKQDDSMDEDDSIVLEEDDEEHADDNNDIVSSQTSVSVSRNRFQLPDHGNNRIDPLLWKQETERVSTLLKKSESSPTVSSDNAWHFHLELLVKYCASQLQHLKKCYEDLKMKAEAVKRIDPMEKPLGKIAKTLEQPPISAQSPLAEALSQLKLQLLADTKKITQNEKYVNLQPVFGSIAREYSVSKKEHEMYEENSLSAANAIGQLTAKLVDVEDQLQDMQELLNTRLNGHDDNGSNRIIRIKEAILIIQKEIREMHINTGMVSEELIQRRKQSLYERERMRKEKYRSRKNKTDGKDDASV